MKNLSCQYLNELLTKMEYQIRTTILQNSFREWWKHWHFKYSCGKVLMQMNFYSMWKNYIMIYGLYHYTFLGWGEGNIMVFSFSHNTLHSQNIWLPIPHTGFSLRGEMEGGKNVLKSRDRFKLKKKNTSLTSFFF